MRWRLAGLAAALLATPVGASPAEPAEAETAPERWAFGGSADFYFAANLADPRRGRNRFHWFTYRDGGGPHLGLVDLWVERRREPLGFRLDLNWGPSAARGNVGEPSDERLWEHVQQAYVSVDLSRDGRTYADFGKWITPAGAEVAEPVDNVFHGQGLLFALSAPFFHLGGRVYHYFADDHYLMAHLNRGWDAVGNPGHGLGLGLTYGRPLAPAWTATISYLGGEERAGGGRAAWRHFLDLIGEFEPEGSGWSGVVNLQAWLQRDALLGGRRREAPWLAAMLLASREIDARQSVGARLEWVHDARGFLAGDGDLYALSLNYTRRVHRHLQLRAEYRHDLAGGFRPFPGRRPGRPGSDQGVFGLSAIVGL